MIVLLGLVVVVVVLLATGVLGVGVFGGSERRPRSGLLAGVAVPVLGVIVLVVLAALVLGLSGGGPDHDDDGDATPPTSRATPRTTPTTGVIASSRITDVTTTIPGVAMELSEEDRFSLYLPIGGLRPGAVVRVRATGFDWHERGRIQQCVTELGRLRSCTDSFPVQFDGDGFADFQLAVSGDFAPGGCRAGQAACSLLLTGEVPTRQASQQFVLVDEFVLGRVTVTPSRGLLEGQTVDVAVASFPAGASATAVLCAPPGAYDPQRCSAPASRSNFVIDAQGNGRATLTVDAGAVHCGPRRPCGVVVVMGNGYVNAAPAPVAFSSGPGVTYDADRVVPGIAVAILLLVIGVGLAVKTDWTKPTEAATPAMDAADLRTDQTLDDLFGADAELDARDPIPW